MPTIVKARKQVSWLYAGLAAVGLATGPACLVPAAAAAPPAAAFAAAPSVKIDNFTFGPAALIVKVGTTVTWTNNDDIPHTVVSSDHTTFKSKVLDTDQSFSFTFTKAGEYAYFCSLHPHMTGKVVVQN
jgi:amicyanin